ncbi:hypothetical protein Tco_0746168 [Tanacetum coccineum]
MTTPPHHLIRPLHSSPKKSLNSIHSLNRSDWFFNNPTPRSFSQRRTMEKSCLLSSLERMITLAKENLKRKGVQQAKWNPIITEGCPSNLKIPCNIGHVHVEKAYIDPNSPLNIMTRMMYNWIIRRKLDPRENSNRGVSNFTRRVKGIHVFVGNFTYIIDFMIIEDISSIIDPRLSQVVLGKPLVEISNMTHDSPKGVVRFTNETDEVAYKMPHMME